MNAAFRRSKMVSFRLSPEEYERVRRLCSENGVRSISDLARTALHKLVAAEHQADPLSFEVRDLRSRVDSLSIQIDRLSQDVEARKVTAS